VLLHGLTQCHNRLVQWIHLSLGGSLRICFVDYGFGLQDQTLVFKGSDTVLGLIGSMFVSGTFAVLTQVHDFIMDNLAHVVFHSHFIKGSGPRDIWVPSSNLLTAAKRSLMISASLLSSV